MGSADAEPMHSKSTVAALPVELRMTFPHRPVPLPDSVLRQYLTVSRSHVKPLNLFDCARLQSFGHARGGKEVLQMIETVTAVLGLVSAGIFLAHAFDGFRSRA